MSNTVTKSSINGKNNLLIRRAIMNIYPAEFAIHLAISINFMIDSLLAGFFFSPMHIAAIGIGSPIYMMMSAIVAIFSNGMRLKMSSCIGRGDSEETKRTYSLGIIAQIILGTLFCIITIVFAKPLVILCGAREDVVLLASNYLRYYSPSILFSAISLSICNVLSLYGYSSASFKLSTIGLFGNVIFSFLFVKFTNLGIAGLGLGTVVAKGLSVIVGFLIIMKKKIDLKIKLFKFKVNEILQLIKLGLPSSCDRVIESFVSSVINNILVTALGTIAISIYSVTKGIINLSYISSRAAITSASPLLGIMFGARDKNGMKRSFRDAYLLSFVTTIIWGAVIYLSLPLLLKFYGMDAPDISTIIRPGVLIGTILITVITINNLFISIFEVSGRFLYALCFSVIADSILFPLLLPTLLKTLGYTGLWIGNGLCILAVIIIYLLITCISSRTIKPSFDILFKLNADLREHAPKLDISINADNANVQGISEKIHNFLNQYGTSKRTAYMASLCTEELAVDLVEHMNIDGQKQKEIMDIKLFVDDGSVSILIRNDASPYNPLNFKLDEQTFSKMGVVMAQKVARKIDYNYMFRMNVITIVLDSNKK